MTGLQPADLLLCGLQVAGRRLASRQYIKILSLRNQHSAVQRPVLDRASPLLYESLECRVKRELSSSGMIPAVPHAINGIDLLEICVDLREFGPNSLDLRSHTTIV